MAVFNNDDEKLARIRSWLSSQGHRAFTARFQDMRDAECEVLSVIAGSRADVVLFDVGRPFVSSWDFGEVLQLITAGEHVPFVITTVDKAELERCIGRTTSAYGLTGSARNLAGLLKLIDAAVAGAAFADRPPDRTADAHPPGRS